MALFNFDYEVRPPKPPPLMEPVKEKPAPRPEALARFRRISGRVQLGLSFAPWLTLAAWTAYAEASRFALGHYPHYMWESVPYLVDHTFGELAALSLWLLVFSVPTWIFLALWRTKQWKDRIFWRSTITYLLGWASLLLVGYLDPVGFVNWFLD